MGSGEMEKNKAMDRVDQVSHIDDAPPEGNPLPWWKQAELRKLYGLTTILFLGSTTLGFDGSLLNGLQTMEAWRECMLSPILQSIATLAGH